MQWKKLVLSDKKTEKPTQNRQTSQSPQITFKIQTTVTLITIATALKSQLNMQGFNADIFSVEDITKEIKKDVEGDNIYYIFLSIFVMSVLPNRSPYYIYNLEQTEYHKDFPRFKNLYPSVEKQDFNEEAFRRCAAVFDYSATNIDNYPDYLKYKVSYLPFPLLDSIGIKHAHVSEKTTDVLFFGTKSKRRADVIQYLYQQNIKIRVFGSANYIYGHVLYEEIRKAKVIINIHHKEQSILEIGRLHDCLRRYPTHIISEMPIDKDADLVKKYKDLNLVTFIPVINEDLSNISMLHNEVKKAIETGGIDFERTKKGIEILNDEIVSEYKIFETLGNHH